MADSKVVVSKWSPDFVTELVPAADRTALLYHLAYICLGGFPKLQVLIKDQALQTQKLFESSEVVLIKCVSTSSSLVDMKFPELIKSLEKSDSNLAAKILDEIRAIIDGNIKEVEVMIKRYDEHNQKIASSTSDVVQAKLETNQMNTQFSEEIKKLKESRDKLLLEQSAVSKSLADLEIKLEAKNKELKNHLKDVADKDLGFTIFAALVPFIGAIAKFIYDSTAGVSNRAKTEALKAEVARLNTDKNILLDKDWKIQIKLSDYQLQIAKAKIKLGVVPSAVHLTDAQQCLTQIQGVLIQMKKFWEKVRVLLDSLKEKTFVNDTLIKELADMKKVFITSIEAAKTYWQHFGDCCQKAQDVFKAHSLDAYKFLQINPSTLSPADWEKQHKIIMDKLNQMAPVAISN